MDRFKVVIDRFKVVVDHSFSKEKIPPKIKAKITHTDWALQCPDLFIY